MRTHLYLLPLYHKCYKLSSECRENVVCYAVCMSYSDFITSSLNQAADEARQYFGHVSGYTKPGDPTQVLTEADLAIGKLLVEAVRKSYQDHNIIDEESGVTDNGSRYTWVIDPIEATSNFAAGLPDYGIMIGLLDGANPIAGGIIAPTYDRLYLAEKGRGATCNDQPIHASNESDLSKMLVSISLNVPKDDGAQLQAAARLLANVVAAARNFRNTDCEAIDPMYVAEGRYGGRVNLTSRIWDNVAPQIICQEAGAFWTDISGSPIDYTNPLSLVDKNFAFCAAPPALHEQLIAILKTD